MGGKPAGDNATRKSKVRITKKQAALVKAAVADPNATLAEIGRKAGYKGDDNSASAAASRALKSANVVDAFRAAMDKRPKLQHAALLKKLEEGLEATATKFFAHEGHVVDQEETTDFQARHSYLTLAAKLRGLGADKVELTGAGGKDLIPQPQIIAVPQLTKEQLLALIAAPDGPIGGTEAQAGEKPA